MWSALIYLLFEPFCRPASKVLLLTAVTDRNYCIQCLTTMNKIPALLSSRRGADTWVRPYSVIACNKIGQFRVIY